MTALQTTIKPLVLAIAVASSQAYAISCSTEYTVSSTVSADKGGSAIYGNGTLDAATIEIEQPCDQCR